MEDSPFILVCASEVTNCLNFFLRMQSTSDKMKGCEFSIFSKHLLIVIPCTLNSFTAWVNLDHIWI